MYTKNDHFLFGFDQQPGWARSDLQQKFFIQFGKCQRQPYDFRTETQIAAREIHESMGDSIVLCLSGGIDSELMAESFFHARVPVRAMIMRFSKDLNLHDIAWAIAYCERRGIKYEFFDLDIEAFFHSGEFREYAKKGQCGYPFILPHLKMLNHIYSTSRIPIVGDGDLHFRKAGQSWVYYAHEFWYSYEKYCKLQGYENYSKFFHWSPELILSYLLAPRLQQAFNNPLLPLHDLGPIKHYVYNDYYICPERAKYRGYEKVPHLHHDYMKIIQNEFAWPDQFVQIEVNQLQSQLAGL